MAHRYLGPPLTQRDPFALAAHAPPRAAPACHTHESAARPSRHHTKKMKQGVPSTRARRARERPRRSPSHHARQARALPCAPPPLPERGARAVPPPRCRGDAKAQGQQAARAETEEPEPPAAGRKMPLEKKNGPHEFSFSRARARKRRACEPNHIPVRRTFRAGARRCHFFFPRGFLGVFFFFFFERGSGRRRARPHTLRERARGG